MGGGGYYWREFALQKWFDLYLSRDLASGNAAPERMWVEGWGNELHCKYHLYAPEKYKHSISVFCGSLLLVVVRLELFPDISCR